MPNSLWDMFQPQDAAGQPTDLGGALTGRSNSLIGLGLGLLSPSNPLRGQSSWGQGLEGFQAGAQIDARTAAQKASLAQHAADRRQAQANADRAFKQGQITDFQKIQADIDKYGEPARQFYAPKTEGDWKIAEVPHPLYPDQKIPVWANARTRETRPLTGGEPPATTSVAADPNAPDAMPSAAAPTAGATAMPVPGRAWAPPPAGSNLTEYNKEKTKEYVKQQAEAEQRAKKAGRIDPVSEDIDRAINAVEASPGLTTGFGGQMMRHIGGSKAGDVEGLINTIKANSSIDKLQELKSQSQTGASGLGAISDKEQSMLQAAIGELDQSRSPEQLKYNLDRVKRIRHEIIHGVGTAPEPRFAPPSEQRAPSARQTGGGGNAPPRPGFVKGGYVFKGGDPSDQNNWAPVR